MKQWTPIKIANKVWVERFEEEDNLAWGYMDNDMSGTVTQSNPYFNTTFNFGESTTQHGLYNTWFMYFKRMKHPRFKHIVIGNPVAIYHTELRQVLLMTIVYQMQRP